ncbi:sulfatase-like hydrolase/transferase [Haloferula sp. A504]|uniref:sulfatase-like hydrolase/transferase n=1 Tax=Haloferula sp. A504 TaxID=3373601 RepID=UPI0031C1F9F6|nr:sulfatase-like hydrolase/transferase [Verrucomicrobiaceae bacterium E54]
MKPTQRFLLFALSPMLAAGIRAEVIATEYFNGYGTSEITSNGSNLNGGSGWGGAWTPSDIRYLPGTSLSPGITGYENSANLAGPGDGALAYATSANPSIAIREFTTSATTVWFSALISIDESIDRAVLWIDSSGLSDWGNDFVGVLDGNIQMRYDGNNLTSAGAPSTGTHLLLAKAELNVSGANDRLSFWFNPDLSGGEAGLGAATYSQDSADTFGTSLDGIGALLVNRSPDGSGGFNTDVPDGGELMDAIRVGTTFADVTEQEAPPPPPIRASDGFPNILILLADDIGYEALGAYGGQDFITPNLDTMAAQGVRFSRAYTSPACTPSRVSMHTSLHTPEHGKTSTLPVHLGQNVAVDFQAMPTFAQLLQARGYQTSTTGKWQLATLTFHPDHIADAGFDSWCVWQIWDGSAKTERYWNPYLNRDGTVLGDIADRFGPDVLEEYVWERMTDARDADEPFLIVHNMLLPHDPITETPQDRALGRPASLGSMIEYLDHLVGRTLDKVGDLGIRDNTYVFFIGDNGTESNYFNPRTTNAGQVFGGKRDLTDAGTHVPLLVWGPPGLNPGSVVNDLIDITDIFPTVCQLARTEIPGTIPYRGTSFVPQLHGRRGIPRAWVHHGFQSGVAVSDGEWRLDNADTLRDSRNLPAEPVAAPGAEADAARAKLEPLLDADDGATSALDGWRSRYFGDEAANPALEASLWGHLANPDHDSLVNLFEYLLGFDPRQADTQDGPLFLSLEGGRPAVHAIARIDDPSLAAVLQGSQSLAGWVSADTMLDLVAAPALNRSFVEARYLWPEASPAPDRLMFRFGASEGE